LKLVPQGTKVVAEINIKAAAESETGKYLKQNMGDTLPGKNIFDNFTQQTGINVAKDVTSITFCGDGQKERENAGFVILNGQWDVAAVAAAFPKAKNFATREYGKYVIMNWDDNTTLYACLVNNSLAIMAASETVLKKALDTLDGKIPNIASDPAFVDFNPVAKKPFIIARVKDVNAMAANDQRAAAAQQVSTISLQVEEAVGGNGVNIDVDLGAISAEAAEQLATMLNGMQAMAQMQGANNPDLMALTKTLKITHAGQKVSIKLTLSPETIKQLATTVAAFGKGRNGAQGWPTPVVPPAFQ
jgi:hypothetical protein